VRTTSCGRTRWDRVAAGTVRVLLSAFFGAVVVGAVAPPADAHTALKDSDPKAGAQVSAPPKEISLEFTEPISAQLTRVTVRGPGGGSFESGPPQVGSATVVQPLRPLGAAGEYQIVYRVVADDGHPLTGTVRFTLTAAASGSGSGAATSAPTSSATSSAAPAPGSTAGASSAAPTGATGDAGGGVSPWWIAIGAVAAVAVVGGAVWFGRRATRGFE
jgi:copper resistance protein C